MLHLYKASFKISGVFIAISDMVYSLFVVAPIVCEGFVFGPRFVMQ